ncbi:MAG: ABC transporter ATP-binding protein [Verrucomicrobiales bacterium]|jgi:oligopeptide transport system ATP-binding protein|nr:ABC transporter ATP-binding protein [Verrucomicrobiales bacterium]MBP9223770.1 ABC transporter ATP-binding protein [Verrucomicrobiales bacterium]HQZ27531.1 ATP-binding cassette domain-containing protein [Verrucomicrobiales bacterium]
MSYLELENLTRHFVRRSGWPIPRKAIVRAVDGVSLKIEKGEILGLVGESGCGKSTLSRLIMQLLAPTSGSVVLEGERLADLPPKEIRKRRRDFQMIFQDPYASLNPRMTVFSTLAEAILTRRPELSGNRSALESAVATLMGRVGLDSRYIRKYPHEFSGGQRQRIAIARALGPEPKLVLADEPVSALDVSIQSQILNLLLELRAELGLTMVFISHDLSVVRYIADRIAVMDEGKIVEVGESNALFENPESEVTRTLLAAIPQIRRSA